LATLIRDSAPKPESPDTAYEIIFDGGAIGNPGKGYGSFVIRNADGMVKRQRVEFGDWITNNQAEYRTLIEALLWLQTFAGECARSVAITIYGDSVLVINQIEGNWKVRNSKLMPLFSEATALLAQFGEVRLKWQPRAASVRVLGH